MGVARAIPTLLLALAAAGCALPEGGAPRSLAGTANAYGFEPAWRPSPAPTRTLPPSATEPVRPRPAPAVAPVRPPPMPRIVAPGTKKENAFHANCLIVGVPRAGVHIVEGRALSAQQLEMRLRTAARDDPKTVVVIRPSPGVPQYAVQRIADFGESLGLHSLPFPAR